MPHLLKIGLKSDKETIVTVQEEQGLDTSHIATLDTSDVSEPMETLRRDELESSEAESYTLADIHYNGGLRIVFLYDEATDEYGLAMEAQTDTLGQTGAFFFSDYGTPLEAFLALTPQALPIPEELLAFQVIHKNCRILPHIEERGIASECIFGQYDLSTHALNPEAPRIQTCTSAFYNWSHWLDSAKVGLAHKKYFSSEFGGKCFRADSYIYNCLPLNAPGHLWARHQFTYKNAGGNYVVQFSQKALPGGAVTFKSYPLRGAVKRYRMIYYDDAWGGSPNTIAKYTREGRFRSF